MIESIAFCIYPVTDFKASRHFYEDLLGLNLAREFGGEWFEYDLGDATFAITGADAEHPVPVRGAALAFEVTDLEAEVKRLHQVGVAFHQEITETSVCRFAVILE
jgi:catechol 2,3-dioxygenase-like lactoylglutathione lyase family enzyme